MNGRTIMRVTAAGWNVHHGGTCVGKVERALPSGYLYRGRNGDGVPLVGWNTNRRAAADALVRHSVGGAR